MGVGASPYNQFASYATPATSICQAVAGNLGHFFWPVACSAERARVQTNEPERPGGVTAIILIAGCTTYIACGLNDLPVHAPKFTLRCDSGGDVFVAIGDEEVCNDYTED
jgi:hypothetical protein